MSQDISYELIVMKYILRLTIGPFCMKSEARNVTYVIQLLKEKPAMLRISSITTSFPLQAAFEVSACHTGAVAVFRPFPRPATMRPTIIWVVLYEEICRIAPMLITCVPSGLIIC